jgi:uncharacterized membrane protein YeiH
MHGSCMQFWMKETGYLWLCLGVSLATFISWPLLKEQQLLRGGLEDLDTEVLWWADTAGLAAFSVIGAQHAIRLGLASIVSCAGGVVIVLGGVIRDLLCGRTIALGGPDPYASTTLLGASVYVASRQVQLKTKLKVPLHLRIAIAASSVCMQSILSQVMNVRWQLAPSLSS